MCEHTLTHAHKHTYGWKTEFLRQLVVGQVVKTVEQFFCKLL